MAKRQLSMLSFIPKANADEKKQKKETDVYDRDDNRKIKSKWFKQFSWLKYTDEKFYCEICKTGNKTNIFTSGKSSERPKKDDFIKHENTQDHRDAGKIPKYKETFSKAATNAYIKCQAGITALMRTIYTMAKQQISTIKLNSLTEMQILNGCESLRPLLNLTLPAGPSPGSLTQPLSYSHHTSVDDIYEVLSDSIENQIINDVLKSNFFSVQIDEGTDCSNLSTLMIFIRYLVEGKVNSRFFSVVELPGASAEVIFEILLDCLKAKNVDISNLIAVASDGASVMQGVKKGVTTLIKNICPFVIRTHCLAHRLALASEKASKQVPYIVKYIQIINSLGKLCKFSPKFCRELAKAKELHDNNSAGKLKQVFFTRWLSFNDCVQAMVGCFESLISCLHSVSEDPAHGVTAKGLLKNVASFKFIATTYFLADLIGILGILSKCMQKDALLYSNVISQVESAIAAIYVLATNDGPYFEEFVSLVAADPPTEFPMVSRFLSHDISDSAKQRNEFSSVRANLVENMSKFMENWFPDTGVMNAFCCLDPKSVYVNSNNSDKQFSELLQHFGTDKIKSSKDGEVVVKALIEKKAAQTEYNILKGVLKENTSLDIADFYYQFIYQNTEGYPNVSILYEAALVAPCTSVECERGFSQYNLIKTNHRNLLSVVHVNQLSMISIEGPSIKTFNFESAFNVWIQKRDRRGFKVMFDRESAKTEVKENENVKENQGTEEIRHVVETEDENNNEEDVFNVEIENKIRRLENLLMKVVEKQKGF